MDPAGGALKAFSTTARRFAALRYALRYDSLPLNAGVIGRFVAPPLRLGKCGQDVFQWLRTASPQRPGEVLCRGRSPLEDVGERRGFLRGRENRNSLPLKRVFAYFLHEQKAGRRSCPAPGTQGAERPFLLPTQKGNL